jgi:REP element-mobilizing transposase RayT
MSYSKIHVHMVWSTKYRRPQLAPEIRADCFSFMSGIAQDLGAHPIIINGVVDHVHCLIDLPRTKSIAQIAKDVKSRSSAWMNEKANRTVLRWQDEYAAFGVSPGRVEAVTQYIARQEEHHRNKSFKDELVELLQSAGIEYNERYLFEIDPDDGVTL